MKRPAFSHSHQIRYSNAGGGGGGSGVDCGGDVAVVLAVTAVVAVECGAIA